ncbi:unnamed protein product [Orchesella dallaii]|uniref:Phospholipid scramblase n=1 Tax=Orchesella dallaii TaxID=48710 RepID=A0ABP1RDV3_9HEXA
MKKFDFLHLIMGNSKHSVVSKNKSEARQTVFSIPSRKASYPTDSYADTQLGRLRSIDHRLGKVLLKPNEIDDGLCFDSLKSVTSFVFVRKCEKPHGGFGFYCDATFRQELSDIKFVIQQMTKPKRKFQGMEDGPLDVFDISPDMQRQILGIIPIKHFHEEKKRDIIEGAQVFCVKGIIGVILIKEDWTNAYEVKNNEGDTILLAQRFNRLSGGYEFQIYSLAPNDLAMVVATVVRLEEAKFILKIYAPCPPPVKALLISFTLFFMYLISR